MKMESYVILALIIAKYVIMEIHVMLALKGYLEKDQNVNALKNIMKFRARFNARV
jgi:hypothetical protein